MSTPCPHCRKPLPAGTAGDSPVVCPACGKPLSAPDDASQPADKRRLGGYEIVKSLGQGGMGAVYLARQLSLDREVALKVMRPDIARNPTFLARFLREALAAAKLVHPHVVQIYDVGEDRGVRYFSMELVRGASLGQVLRKKTRLDVVHAARYILQAARGLLFAHNRGIVHRDVKPDNLLLDELGIIKIADLGLVKMPVSAAAPADSVNLTAAGTTVGTAAYMAPEQARASGEVDQRADIYSLGCTFYTLLAGRPPFAGTSSLEIMTRHCTDPPPPLESRVPGVPPAVVAIINRMLAKRPDDRYPDCRQLIADLRRFLDRASGKDALPNVEHVARLQTSVRRFQTPMARLRNQVLLACLGAVTVAIPGALVIRRPVWAMAICFLALLAGLARLLLEGYFYRTPVFVKLRELALETRRTDWLLWGVGTAVVVVLFVAVGMGAALPGLIILAVGWAVTLHFLLDRKAAKERRPIVEGARRLLEELRTEGLDEETLQHFVYEHGGDAWEDFFEALFGYEWMLRTRQEWARAEGVARRPRHLPWRDPLIRWLDSLCQARREAREREMLANVAAAGVGGASDVVATGPWPPLPATPGPTTDYKPHAGGTPPRLADDPFLTPQAFTRPRRSLSEQLAWAIGTLFGPRTRGLAGLLLVAACVLWSFDSLNPGIAGLVLLLSLFWRSWRMNVFLLPAAAVILFGEALGVPALGPLAAHHISLILGGILLAMGFIFDYAGAPRATSRDDQFSGRGH